MPFVTEELYHRLCLLTGEPRSSVISRTPVPGAISAPLSTAEEAMDTVDKIAASIRARAPTSWPAREARARSTLFAVTSGQLYRQLAERDH